MNFKSFRFKFLIIALLLVCNSTYSQTTEQPVLPGQNLDNVAMMKDVDDIVLAKIEALPVRQLLSVGMALFQSSPTKITGVLKGDVKGEIGVSIKVFDVEEDPKVGTEYIIFLRKLAGQQQYSCLKMLPATKENIAAIKALMEH